MSTSKGGTPAFDDTLAGLRGGDFSRLDFLFKSSGGSPSQIVEWVGQGRFCGHDQELAEALTCACFNGRTEVAEYFLNLGIAPSGGAGTGLNAIHWAVNRGQLDAVRLLIKHKVPLESRSMYGVLRSAPRYGRPSTNRAPVTSPSSSNCSLPVLACRKLAIRPEGMTSMLC